MEELKCQDVDALKERMKTCNFNQVIKKLSQEYFDLKKVAGEREQRSRDDNVRGGIQRGRGRGRGTGGSRGVSRRGRGRCSIRGGGTVAEVLVNGDEVDEVGEGLEEEYSSVATHDQVRENATLCIQHLAMSRLFQDAIRSGDTGVVEGMLDILTLFF